MAPIFHHLLLPLLLLPTFSQFYSTTAQSRQLNITLNSSLSPTTSQNSWLSSSGRFAFGFYPQVGGFAVGVWLVEPSGERVIVWTANRDGPPVSSEARLLLSSDRGLLLQSGGQNTSISNTAEPTSLASMLDSGNFVLYNSDSQIIWGTFRSPTDTILGGQLLLPDNRLVSSASETNHSSGRFQMVMQTDGNLVLYPILRVLTVGDAYWASNTDGQGPNVTLKLDESGFIYMFNSTTGSLIMNLTGGFDPPTQRNTTNIYRATLDIDGIFSLYEHRFGGDGSLRPLTVWSLMSDPCKVKGICGINSYCVLNDNQTNCICPHGFDFIDPRQKFQGCVKNFTEEVCRGTKGTVTYNIDSIKNTSWEDNSFSISSLKSEEECREECLKDCNCEAATFKDTACSKQKLPLQYGKRDLKDATTSFIKYSINSSAGPDGPIPPTSSPSPDGVFKPMPPTLVSRCRKVLGVEILMITIAVMSCLCVTLAILGFLIYRHRIGKYMLISETTHKCLTWDAFTPRSFTYDELENATNGFKEELGKGAFGTVYKGALSNGTRMVAVKRLDRVVEEGEREFQTEMSAIGRTYHRNLVQLLGFCADGCHRLLVYEYMSNGSLANLLFSPEGQPNWDERVRIAMDIAKGIIYLHEECESPIIHCDIKPQNILMDEFYRAKISDFGLAKLMKPDQTRTFTGIRGTRGYVAPEWHRSMPVTTKADVYSFGVVLLEIICCRRNIETEAEDEEKILCYWVYECFVAGELQKLVNFEEVDKRSLENMVKVGLWCIQDKPSLRPSMKRVVMMLEGTKDVPTPPLTSFLSSP